MEKTRKVTKYMVIGGIATGIYLGSWWLFALTGMGTTNASVVAFVPTWIFKFLLHKFWVFEDSDATKTTQQALPYALLTFASFCLYYVVSLYLQREYAVAELRADGIAGLSAACVRFVIFRRFFMR